MEVKMKKSANKLNKINLKNFIALTLAGLINAFGVTLFLFPIKLSVRHCYFNRFPRLYACWGYRECCVMEGVPQP